MSFLSAPEAFSFHVLILMLEVGFGIVKVATLIPILIVSVALIKLPLAFTMIMGHHMGTLSLTLSFLSCPYSYS